MLPCAPWEVRPVGGKGRPARRRERLRPASRRDLVRWSMDTRDPGKGRGVEGKAWGSE